MVNPVIFCRNEGLLVCLTICYFALNGFLFAYQYYTLRFDDRFHYLYLMLGEVIFISRATGIVLNFNCALILLPMNRFFNSWIRNHLLKDTKSTIRRLFDHTKGIHILCAFTISAVGVVHTVLHLINGFLFRKHFTEVVPELNIQLTKEDTTFFRFFALVPGYTGIILLFIIFLMGVSSFKTIRRLNHEIFTYLHYLSLVFFAVLVYHGFGKITKYQINLSGHPVQCHNLTNVVENELCKEKAEFDYVKPSSWKWLAGPLAIHILDRLIRFFRARKECKVVAMRHYDTDVIEVVFSKKNFKAKPGQFIWVQCSEISDFEWHAFTLTKVPNKDANDDTFSVHIKVVGDWTMKLSNLVKSLQVNDDNQTKRVGYSCVIELDEKNKEELPVKFRVDGPYGSPHQDAFRYPVNISIATGIGITPFLATLNALRSYRYRTTDRTFKLKKMYLIWVCKSTNEFSWVLDTVRDLEIELQKNNVNNLLELHLFVTRETDGNNSSGKLPTWNLGSPEAWNSGKINYGRPNFRHEIARKVNMHSKERIGVFYCGSQPLGKKIYQQIKNMRGAENALIFNKESFG